MSIKDARFVGRVAPVERFPISIAYWETDASVKEISERFGISSTMIGRNAGPARFKDIACSICGGEIVEEGRSHVISRLIDLEKTHGYGRKRIEAGNCKDCQRTLDDARRKAFFQSWPKAVADAREDLNRERELMTMPYAEYLQTPEWQERRQKALKRAGYACQVCYSNVNLHVHHRTYSHRGIERDFDLTVLCAACHEVFHDRRSLADGGRAAA
jgi:hypothetical protein